MNSLFHIKFTGSPREIGLQHGQQLRNRIQLTWEFYSQILFGNKLAFLEDYGNRYLEVIRAFSNRYGIEIEAIAEGSNLSPWQIAVLNARTEIFHCVNQARTVNECTALFFPSSRTLGQNWDWMEQLEPLMVLMEMEQEDGHKILQLTEPGIIGKIGFNSKGIGVCLNIMTGSESPVSVPIHILLRSALDGKNIDEIYNHFNQLKHGTYSNILLADEKGRFIDMEFAGTSMKVVDYGNMLPLHTNHYLSELRDARNNENDLLYDNSTIRYERGRVLLDNVSADSGVPELKSILMDRENPDNAICASFRPVFGLPVGTVSSIVMNLPNRTIYITAGNPQRNDYQAFSL